MKVEGAFRSTKGTRSATVSYLKKKAEVDANEGVSVEELVRSVEGAGYKAEQV